MEDSSGRRIGVFAAVALLCVKMIAAVWSIVDADGDLDAPLKVKHFLLLQVIEMAVLLYVLWRILHAGSVAVFV